MCLSSNGVNMDEQIPKIDFKLGNGSFRMRRVSTSDIDVYRIDERHGETKERYAGRINVPHQCLRKTFDGMYKSGALNGKLAELLNPTAKRQRFYEGPANGNGGK